MKVRTCCFPLVIISVVKCLRFWIAGWPKQGAWWCNFGSLSQSGMFAEYNSISIVAALYNTLKYWDAATNIQCQLQTTQFEPDLTQQRHCRQMFAVVPDYDGGDQQTSIFTSSSLKWSKISDLATTHKVLACANIHNCFIFVLFFFLEQTTTSITNGASIAMIDNCSSRLPGDLRHCVWSWQQHAKIVRGSGRWVLPLSSQDTARIYCTLSVESVIVTIDKTKDKKNV